MRLALFSGEPAELGEVTAASRRSRGYVRWVQQALNQVLGMRLALDGRMGPATRSAIRSFQQQRGLRVDGVVGPRTEQALVAAGAPRPRAATPSVAPVAPPAPVVLTPASTTSVLVRGVALPAAPALSVTNFLDPSVPRLPGRTRPGRAVTELIVHETVTPSVATTVKVLQDRGLSVHLIMAPDGTLTQHGDLGDEILWHASQHNGQSVGVEVVNPYYPRALKPGLAWTRTIRAGWAHEGQYVLPTPAQAEAVARLAAWITSPAAQGLSIPRRWIGVSDGRLVMARKPGAETIAPGIYAHTYFNHADGAWLVLYAWLRLEAGMAPSEAYEDAVRRASTPETSVTLPARRPAPVEPLVREAFESMEFTFPEFG